jgi:hypothetical protein
MATNIDLAAELNKLLTDQLKIVEEQNKSLKEQIKLSEAIVETFSKVKTKKTTDAVNNLNNSVKDAAKSGKEFTGSFAEGLNTVAKRTFLADKSTKGLVSTLDKLVKYPIRLLAFEGALSGFHQGIQLSNSLLGTLIGTAQATVVAMGNLGISILTLPFKMLNVLMAEAANISGIELAQAIENVRKQFGDLTRNEGKSVMTSFRSMRGELANTGLSVRRVLGNLAERLDFLRETAVAMGRAFNRFTQEFAQYGEHIAAYVKGLGISGEQIKAVADFSTASGRTMTDVGREMTTMAYGVGEAFNVNGKLVSRDLADMMKDFKNFGNFSVKQLTQVSVFTHKLGLAIEDLLGTIDKFDNFENAAESAAQLSQAFGLQLDTLDMMFDQDPASRFEKLRRSFAATGKTVETLSRQERALLSAQTGLSDAALQVGFSQANMGMSYEEVQKQASLTEKKQLSQAEAMEKLANSIERLVKEGQKMSGGFVDIFLQGFFQGIKWTKEWRTMLLNLRHAMRQIWRAGLEVGQVFVKVFPGVKDVFDGIAGLFDRKRWQGLRKGLVDVFKTFFTDVSGNSPFSLQKLFYRLQEIFFNHFNLSTPAGQQTVQGFKKFFKGVVNLFAQFVPWIMRGMTTVIKSITSFITDPKKFLSQASNSANPWVKGFIEMLSPIWDAVVREWPKLEKALMELVTLAWTKVKDFAKSHWKEGLTALGLYLVPGLVGGIVKGLAVTLAGALAKTLFNFALPKITEAIAGLFGAVGSNIAQKSGSLAKATSGLDEVITSVAKSETASKKLSISDIGKFGVKMLAIGALLSIGVAAFVYGLVKVANILTENGLNSPEKIAAPLLVMTTAIGAVVAFGFAAKTMSLVPWAAVAKAAVLGAVGIGALGLLSMAVAKFFVWNNEILSDIAPGDAAKTIGILTGMTTGLGILAIAVMGIGAALTFGWPLALAGVAGLAALGFIAAGVVSTAKSLIQQINGLQLGENFSQKLNAFTSVVGSLTSFSKVFLDLMSEAKPSLLSIKGLFGDNGEAIKESLEPLARMVKIITNSVGMIFESIALSMNRFGSNINLSNVSAFAGLLTSVVELASTFSSSNMDKILSKVSDDTTNPEAIRKLSKELASHVNSVSDAIGKLVPMLSQTFKDLGALPMEGDALKKVDAFSTFVNTFTQLASAMQSDQFKIAKPSDGMMNFLTGIQMTMVDVAAMADELKTNYISQAAESIKTMLTLIESIQTDLTKISKSGDIKPLNVQLKQTADKLGLAGTNEIKVKMDEINFHVHVNVKLDVDDLEWALINKTEPKLLRKK